MDNTSNGQLYEWQLSRAVFQSRKPSSLVSKIPMEQAVIDDKGQMFRYHFNDGKIVYEFVCCVIQEIKTTKCPNQSK